MAAITAAQQREHFPVVLRRLRADRGYTQAQLAARCGLACATIESWEQGRRTPKWPQIVTLASALGVSTEAFRAR